MEGERRGGGVEGGGGREERGRGRGGREERGRGRGRWGEKGEGEKNTKRQRTRQWSKVHILLNSQAQALFTDAEISPIFQLFLSARALS